MDKVSGGNVGLIEKMFVGLRRMEDLGILQLDKFARALKLRWPWLLWKHPFKAWIRNDHPCNDADMDFFSMRYGQVFYDGGGVKELGSSEV
jgi:hypothetical protein